MTKPTKTEDTPTTEPIELSVDLDALTYGELEILEEVLGYIPGEEDGGFDAVPRSKMVVALAVITGRRTNPDLTIADVRGMKLGEIVVKTENPS